MQKSAHQNDMVSAPYTTRAHFISPLMAEADSLIRIPLMRHREVKRLPEVTYCREEGIDRPQFPPLDIGLLRDEPVVHVLHEGQ
ncbi:hypothetical protein I79_004784 [Cricetulus griseus]|uniref:Uncharacterized protein n=1 Tax=Cricetulus griseus TaxID=10029 RepID=G3H3G8_CRIGR|nr:hypothetical protein I79_004784 [Cricetulus griseus]